MMEQEAGNRRVSESLERLPPAHPGHDLWCSSRRSQQNGHPTARLAHDDLGDPLAFLVVQAELASAARGHDGVHAAVDH